MTLTYINDSFSVCKLDDYRNVDFSTPPVFLSVTDDEISLVCLTKKLPHNATCAEHGWKAFKIQGELDFSLVGILADISALLASAGISIFAISTYNTDYILIKEKNVTEAISLLKSNGYGID